MNPVDQLYVRLVKMGTGTAILTAALLAGTHLFRSTGLDKGLEPGSYVLIDSLNEPGMALLDRLDEFLVEYASEEAAGLPELVGTGPSESLLELVSMHESFFLAITSEDDPQEVAMRTVALIIRRANDVLDPEMGKNIAAQGLVYACKHAPPSR